MLLNDVQTLNHIYYKTMHNIFDRGLGRGMENSWETLQSLHTELSNSLGTDAKNPLTGTENDARTKSTVKKEILAE